MLWGPIPSQVYTNLVGCLPEASSISRCPNIREISNSFRTSYFYGHEMVRQAAKNDEEKQLRWALAESIRQGTAAVAKNDKDKATQQLLRDAEQQEAVPARSGQKSLRLVRVRERPPRERAAQSELLGWQRVCQNCWQKSSQAHRVSCQPSQAHRVSCQPSQAHRVSCQPSQA
eukprot:g14716.t1